MEEITKITLQTLNLAWGIIVISAIYIAVAGLAYFIWSLITRFTAKKAGRLHKPQNGDLWRRKRCLAKPGGLDRLCRLDLRFLGNVHRL